MKFGSRECTDIVFKAKSTMKIGSMTFRPGQPVLYIDSAKTSTLEGGSATVYATGGRGNANLIGWDGDRTITFTVEDALLSPISFSMLSGAGVFDNQSTSASPSVHVHAHSYALVTSSTSGATTGNVVDLTTALGDNTLCNTAPIFISVCEEDGSLTGEMLTASTVTTAGVITLSANKTVGTKVFVDYYITKTNGGVTELQIDAKHFGGYFYIEADTLFRKQSTGKDMPANITIPNAKIQSNFSISMASSGDPSTFTFTIDAFPGYTYFNPTKQVICVIQIIDDDVAIEEREPVMTHTADEGQIDVDKDDSYDGTTAGTEPDSYPVANG
jgi:hypothetical protein